MKNTRFHLSIAFNDVILPLIDCPDGYPRVPLKPIADQIGVDWKTQKRKLLADDYLQERFGLILGEASLPQMARLGLKTDQYLIRFDRVTAFLNTLNPRMISALGNEAAAEWLKSKHQEWDDVLHAYETNGFVVGRKAALTDLKDLINLRNKALPHEKRWLTTLIEAQARELGVADAQLTDPQVSLPLTGGDAA